MMFFIRLFVSVFTFICCTTLTSGATRLPADEVESLRQIGRTLGKTNWNFSVDPCSGESGWVSAPNRITGFEKAVTCSNCSSDNTTCHIVSIVLNTHNLFGTLPPELARLPYLQEIDLRNNYLNGTLPPEWGSMQLEIISLSRNRLTGSIPREFGNISTLKKLFLNSNNFTGELPGTLAELTALTDFEIRDTQFTGRIPDFIRNWERLETLVIQASGLDGPIPSGIALLTNLTDLRITDLNGTEDQPFPPLNNMKNLGTLILRSCNIVGQLPEYLGKDSGLSVLLVDLTFFLLSFICL